MWTTQYEAEHLLPWTQESRLPSRQMPAGVQAPAHNSSPTSPEALEQASAFTATAWIAFYLIVSPTLASITQQEAKNNGGETARTRRKTGDSSLASNRPFPGTEGVDSGDATDHTGLPASSTLARMIIPTALSTPVGSCRPLTIIHNI
ncbi:hypothetical protein ACJZ2D_000203 [Fusarium nematophilum]